jgi:hypothetical protein
MNSRNQITRLAQRGATLIELMVAALILLAVLIASDLVLRGGLILWAKSFSLNQSGLEVRHSLDEALRKLELAAETPVVSNLNSGVFTAVSGTYGMGIRFHRLVGGNYRLIGPVGTTTSSGLKYTATNATTLTVEYHSSEEPITSNYTVGQSGPARGDRILIINPTGIAQTGTSGSSPGTKPGLLISAVGGVTGSTTRSQTLTLSSAVGERIVLDNRCYFVREAALLAVDVGGRRELRYYDRASDLTKYSIIARNLDANPVETDSNGVTKLPFSLVTSSGLTRVQVHLPVRVNDYVRTLARFRSKDEVNSFARLEVQIPVRNGSISQ